MSIDLLTKSNNIKKEMRHKDIKLKEYNKELCRMKKLKNFRENVVNKLNSQLRETNLSNSEINKIKYSAYKNGVHLENSNGMCRFIERKINRILKNY